MSVPPHRADHEEMVWKVGGQAAVKSSQPEGKSLDSSLSIITNTKLRHRVRSGFVKIQLGVPGYVKVVKVGRWSLRVQGLVMAQFCPGAYELQTSSSLHTTHTTSYRNVLQVH